MIDCETTYAAPVPRGSKQIADFPLGPPNR